MTTDTFSLFFILEKDDFSLLLYVGFNLECQYGFQRLPPVPLQPVAGRRVPDLLLQIGLRIIRSKLNYKVRKYLTSLVSDTQVSQSPWGLLPWRVNLHGVCYPGESISLGSATLASQTPWGLLPWRVKDNIPGVCQPRRVNLPGVC